MKNVLTSEQFLTRENNYNIVKSLIKNFINNKPAYHNNSMKLGHLSFKNGYYSHDYKKDINEFKDFLREYNVSLDSFFDEYKEKIFKDEFFTTSCGFLDAVLYSYDNKFPLSGDYLEDLGTDVDEYIIKYDYGYDNYDLGRKYILQAFDNLNDFYFECAKRYPYELDQRFHWDRNFSKYKDLISFAKKKDNFSICVIDLDTYYNYNNNQDKETKDRFINELIELFRGYKEAHDKNKNFGMNTFEFLYVSAEELMIIGFGKNIDLKSISNSDIRKYAEEIDFNNKVKKYNL